ncbi:MAG: MarR family winged helix-turn-helix transcriptional regulator [Lactobacillus helsingborgensis]|uniref:MarR family winged helix-turn-helix transcriptional regulator n=1 Tax=Lactobacillus TaxID=1578 RepID=UPI000D70410B|nr:MULTISPECIES: MarR family winged helix-turn-helix transcriptional regulator [Lactobacillus]AWN33254.1 MarR family transcriptional regulator [Lactobacillus helsingborgensis]MBI0110648.1 winged helix-turn-helix transcriptional regulator [Lactobacillus sp. W8093]MCT6812047.1 MarR family winged helix-turn-helix transcriptional regulator [Lactobacillus helsingborgensis]RMC53718.1 MarR family transcriptional regulator [Lactobacillus sp. ESL0262]WLT01061.1 MarR family winged helix-turn-helix trans
MNRLGLALQRVQNTFNRNADYYARKIGLTGTQMLIIEYLASFAQNKSIYQKDIEHEFNIRKSTATNVLRLMENKGLIYKKVDQRDTRLKAILLTDKAIKLEEKITNYFISSENSYAAILGADTKKELIENLQKLNKAISEN